MNNKKIFQLGPDDVRESLNSPSPVGLGVVIIELLEVQASELVGGNRRGIRPPTSEYASHD